MRLIIQRNKDEVADWVATYVMRRINDFAPTAEKPFVIGLPTGGSPIKTYERLIQFVKEGKLSFEHVISFNMDEYVNLPEDHPESYHSFMKTHLFDHVDMQECNINILNGNAPDLKEECASYEERILAVGGIELFLGGIGPDGHIAFNEPGSSMVSRTRVKSLAYDTIVANSRFFDGDLAQVPKMALTVGVGTVMDAREVLIIVTGINKSIALEKVVEDGVNHMWTVSQVQQHPRACIACDDDATVELKVRTVNYFNGIRETHKQAGLATMDGDTAASVAARRVRKMSDASRRDAVRLVGTEPSSPRRSNAYVRYGSGSGDVFSSGSGGGAGGGAGAGAGAGMAASPLGIALAGAAIGFLLALALARR
jgi:glucosamine-6-phosphate deaminase